VNDAIWDDKHLKAVLRLPRYPLALIEEEPWHASIERHGGLRAVHDYLNTCSLPPHEQELLALILRHPGASVQFYCERLCISRRTYANYLNSLCVTLLLHLNAWSMASMSIVETSAYHGNIPAPITALIGAEETLSAVLSLLREPAVRCVTLTGPGGVGKTRLAIEVANKVQADFADGVYLIALDAISDPALLSATIIRVLNLQLKGVDLPLEALKTYLRSRRLLFVLDNLEHLSGIDPVVTALLQAAPGLKILSTSREMLNISGEYCFTVAPLPVPDRQMSLTVEALQEYPAVQLFVERARAVRQGFALTAENAATLVQICGRLDGLPLAIELAAARIRTYSLEQVLAQLEGTLAVLRYPHHDRPVRHQSLWNVIEWSYLLLSPQHKVLFRCLSVFDHSWNLKAAQAVCECAEIQQGLEELVGKSLVQPVSSRTDVRFYMLNTLREYALEQLCMTGEAESVGRRHAWHYLLQSETAETALGKANHLVWADWLQYEHGNLQTALRWMLEHDEPVMALRLVGAIWRFWQVQGVLTEGRYWLARALAASAEVADNFKLKALWGAGWLAENQSDIPAATACFEEGLLLAQKLEEPRWIALLQTGMGQVRRAQQRYPEAGQLFESSREIFTAIGDREEVAWSLDQLSRLALEQEDLVRARQFAEASLALFRELQHHWGMSHALDHLGDAVWNQEQYDLAAAFFEEALQQSEALQSRWLAAWTLCKLTSVRLAQGEIEQARTTLAESLRLHLQVENTLGMVACLGRVAMFAAAQNAWRDTVRFCAATQTLHRNLKLPPLTTIFVRGMNQALDEARIQLDSVTFEEAWAQGQNLTLPQAINHARCWLGIES